MNNIFCFFVNISTATIALFFIIVIKYYVMLHNEEKALKIEITDEKTYYAATPV